jgi:hypothetical protein
MESSRQLRRQSSKRWKRFQTDATTTIHRVWPRCSLAAAPWLPCVTCTVGRRQFRSQHLSLCHCRHCTGLYRIQNSRHVPPPPILLEGYKITRCFAFVSCSLEHILPNMRNRGSFVFDHIATACRETEMLGASANILASGNNCFTTRCRGTAPCFHFRLLMRPLTCTFYWLIIRHIHRGSFTLKNEINV